MIEIRQSSEYRKWFDSLRDVEARARIEARLRRASLGNPGDIRSVGAGVMELRVQCGAGYRVYFTWQGESVIVLLVGGDKSSQRRDIMRAHELARRL